MLDRKDTPNGRRQILLMKERCRYHSHLQALRSALSLRGILNEEGSLLDGLVSRFGSTFSLNRVSRFLRLKLRVWRLSWLEVSFYARPYLVGSVLWYYSSI